MLGENCLIQKGKCLLVSVNRMAKAPICLFILQYPVHQRMSHAQWAKIAQNVSFEFLRQNIISSEMLKVLVKLKALLQIIRLFNSDFEIHIAQCVK